MIILTGASGGIGRSLIDDLKQIDQVIGIYNKSNTYIKEAENLTFKKLDISNEEEIKNFINENKIHLKNITIVHGAGITEDKLAVNLDRDKWDNVLNVNLTANFLLSKALIPLMIQQSWGRIVHLSSIRTAPGTLSYSTTKAGLIGMSGVLAKEYSKFNITSNALILGAFDTGMFQSLDEKVQHEMINQIPSKKLGHVKNISHAIEFLIKSPFVSGASIVIDGAATV
jgi:3-oxoacyl-[acyl-carrier protein] reductase